MGVLLFCVPPCPWEHWSGEHLPGPCRGRMRRSARLLHPPTRTAPSHWWRPFHRRRGRDRARVAGGLLLGERFQARWRCLLVVVGVMVIARSHGLESSMAEDATDGGLTVLATPPGRSQVTPVHDNCKPASLKQALLMARSCRWCLQPRSGCSTSSTAGHRRRLGKVPQADPRPVRIIIQRASRRRGRVDPDPSSSASPPHPVHTIRVCSAVATTRHYGRDRPARCRRRSGSHLCHRTGTGIPRGPLGSSIHNSVAVLLASIFFKAMTSARSAAHRRHHPGRRATATPRERCTCRISPFARLREAQSRCTYIVDPPF